MLAVVAVTLVLVTVVVGLGRVVVARAEAQSAADLAALAAATRLRGSGDPAAACDLAVLAASRNDADLSGCRWAGSGVVDVDVSVTTPFGPATATARAGPRDDP